MVFLVQAQVLVATLGGTSRGHYAKIRGMRKTKLAIGRLLADRSEELMTNEELSQTLTRLQDQLSRTAELDEATVRSLRALLDEIEAATVRTETGEGPEIIAPATAPPAESAAAIESQAVSEPLEELSLSQRMRKAVEEFEFRHPQLTVTLSQIADSLAEMGI